MTQPRIALFLGAGASVSYNKPTTAMFREELKDKFPEGSALYEMLNSDVLPDIEYVLQAGYDILDCDNKVGGKHFRLLSEHGKMNIQGHSYSTFIESLDDGVSKLEELFFSRYKWNSEDDSKLSLLQSILNFLANINPRTYVFTTNYDTAVERCCKDASLRIVDGFKHDEQLRGYRWDGFSSSDYETENKHLYLYKLHGSLNWIKTDDGVERVPVEKHDKSIKKFIIYPNLSAKLNGKRRPYNEIWNEFEKIMNDISILIVIGYSFRDEHIADIIRNMVHNGMHMLVVSPTSMPDCEKLFATECPFRVRTIDEKFDSDGVQMIYEFLDNMTDTMSYERL